MSAVSFTRRSTGVRDTTKLQRFFRSQTIEASPRSPSTSILPKAPTTLAPLGRKDNFLVADAEDNFRDVILADVMLRHRTLPGEVTSTSALAAFR